MRYSTCNLPNGETLTVTPVFGGFSFKSNDLTLHHSVLPPGWTVSIYTLGDHPNPEQQQGTRETESTVASAGGAEVKTNDEHDPESAARDHSQEGADKHLRRRFTTPTLRNDCLHIASTVSPSSDDFKPAVSPTRQIALVLWATLWWYFHEPEPDLHEDSEQAAGTPLAGKPKGDWRITIKREGILKKRNLLPKLERMGLVVSEESEVGLELNEGADSSWDNTFMSRRSFWQLDPRLFLFTLAPAGVPTGVGSTATRGTQVVTPGSLGSDGGKKDEGVVGPFTSGSHLPTYFPPRPTQYTFTNGVRHPIRPKPPRQGEVLYIRYVPSVGQYLSFRVPYLPSSSSSSSSSALKEPDVAASSNTGRPKHSSQTSTSSALGVQQPPSPDGPSDLDLLHKWMNDPRVNTAWGEGGPITKQEAFLRHNLTSRHSFPVLGCWDGKPFGYFEIYWVKEDRLGPLLASGADNYDRGIHLLVGEQEYRGAHRLAVWLSSLVHYCWLADLRTQTVMLEPRVDNQK